MKTARISTLFLLLVAGFIQAQQPGGFGLKGVGDGSSELTKLIADSHWTWYEGAYDSYKGKTKYWIEFYRDGTARVPWRDHNQYWKLTDSNTLTVTDQPTSGEKRVFTMNLAEKSGSTADQKLHIRYENRSEVQLTWRASHPITNPSAAAGGSATPAPEPSAPASTPAPAVVAALTPPAMPGPPQRSGSPMSAADVVKSNRSNLVFVTTADGAGSGFIAHYGTGTFLITNAHVAAGARGAMFKTLEGTQVQIGTPAVAVGHDIFLMALKPGGSPLEVMSGVDQGASIGDAVVVLGNAEGAGVINTILGKIVGLGPNLVEVDAPFQPGNSGSPIIHLNTGKVIGVATYLTIRKYDSATKQPIKDPIIRRFGYRLDSVKNWQAVQWQAFYGQAAEMESIEKLTDDLAAFLQDLGKEGRVSRGAHTNPVIKTRIDQWLETKAKRLSAHDAVQADQSLLSFLKITSQSDITAAQQHLTYDYFQRQLTDQQRERKEIADVFTKIIDELRK